LGVFAGASDRAIEVGHTAGEISSKNAVMTSTYIVVVDRLIVVVDRLIVVVDRLIVVVDRRCDPSVGSRWSSIELSWSWIQSSWSRIQSSWSRITSRNFWTMGEAPSNHPLSSLHLGRDRSDHPLGKSYRCHWNLNRRFREIHHDRKKCALAYGSP